MSRGGGYGDPEPRSKSSDLRMIEQLKEQLHTLEIQFIPMRNKVDAAYEALINIANHAAHETGKDQHDGDTYDFILKLAKIALEKMDIK